MVRLSLAPRACSQPQPRPWGPHIQTCPEAVWGVGFELGGWQEARRKPRGAALSSSPEGARLGPGRSRTRPPSPAVPRRHAGRGGIGGGRARLRVGGEALWGRACAQGTGGTVGAERLWGPRNGNHRIRWELVAPRACVHSTGTRNGSPRWLRFACAAGQDQGL
jgi:hypothetical protein